MNRPKLFFIVKYIAPLKYYAKLIPALQEKYDVGFVLLADRGMVLYCNEKKYLCYQLFVENSKPSKIRIPFVSVIIKHNDFLRRADLFLKKEKPAKLIAVVSRNFHIQVIFEKANKLEIKTIALSWAMQNERIPNQSLPLSEKFKKFIERSYFSVLDPLLALSFRIISGYWQDFRNHKAEKIGVISKTERDFFISQGYDPTKIRIVGDADYDYVHKLREKIDREPSLKLKLQKKYGIDRTKKQILLLTIPFYLGKSIRFTDGAGQINYFKTIIDLIREVFTLQEADVLLKCHPKEPNIYGSLSAPGVKIFLKEAMTEELLCLSDLCLSHPETTANFSVLATGIPAIFINFSPITSIDRGKDYFHIKNLLKDPKEFTDYLKQFKAGILPKQYDASHFDSNAIKAIVEFIS